MIVIATGVIVELVHNSWITDFLPFTPLPNDKILDVTKFKAFADDKLNASKLIVFSLTEWKTLWEKEKMLFSVVFSLWVVKSRDHVEKS